MSRFTIYKGQDDGTFAKVGESDVHGEAIDIARKIAMRWRETETLLYYGCRPINVWEHGYGGECGLWPTEQEAFPDKYAEEDECKEATCEVDD